MDEFREKKKKLLGLKKQILRMPNNMVKSRMIDGYNFLLHYLIETNNISDDIGQYEIEKDFVNKYDRYVINETQKKINDITKVSPLLYSKYSDLIALYKENDFCSYEYSQNDRVKKDEMYDHMFEFMMILGKDVCNLYNNMVKEGNVFLLPGFDSLGVSMNSIPVDNPCIIINSVESYFEYYVVLLHELGHCYQFYLQRNHNHLESFNPFTETTSLLFEKMFCEYLKRKKIYQKTLDNYELEDHIYFLNDISISRILCVLMMQGDIRNISAYDLSYESTYTLEELLFEAEKDCGYIMENKLNMALTEFHYSLGSIFATYFLNKMKDDFKGAWKEYKDFICMVDYYPLEEIIDKYFDVPLMKDNIKTFIKNYRNR